MPLHLNNRLNKCYDQYMSYIQLNAPPQLVAQYSKLAPDVGAFTLFIRGNYRMKLGLDYHIYTVGHRVLVIRPRLPDSEAWFHGFVELARFHFLLQSHWAAVIRSYPDGRLPAHVLAS
jgi:hypothetical protein